MIYTIRAGSYTFVTADTQQLTDDGYYFGTANLPVKNDHNWSQGDVSPYIVPVTHTVYLPSTSGGTAQYLTITSVTPSTQFRLSNFTQSMDILLVVMMLLVVLGVWFGGGRRARY